MPRLIRIVRQLWDSTDPYRSVYFEDAGYRVVVDREHRKILKAIRARETDKAIELLAEHRAGTVDSLRRLLVKQENDDVVV